MKKILIALLATSVVFTIACNSGTPPTKAADGTVFHGEKFEIAAAPATMPSLIQQLNSGATSKVTGIGEEEKDGIVTQLSGEVMSACQAKGCWMKIRSTEGDSVFVRFKDYGFFVPKDIKGKKVVINGNFYKDLTSVADLKHYAGDAKQSQAEIDAITEPKVEYKFYASGVAELQK